MSAPSSSFSYRQVPRATAPQRIPSHSLVAGVFLNDLHSFSPTSNTWTEHNATHPPSVRDDMGFAATPDGVLYVFGGYANGEERVQEGRILKNKALTR